MEENCKQIYRPRLMKGVVGLHESPRITLQFKLRRRGTRTEVSCKVCAVSEECAHTAPVRYSLWGDTTPLLVCEGLILGRTTATRKEARATVRRALDILQRWERAEDAKAVLVVIEGKAPQEINYEKFQADCERLSSTHKFQYKVWSEDKEVFMAIYKQPERTRGRHARSDLRVNYRASNGFMVQSRAWPELALDRVFLRGHDKSKDSGKVSFILSSVENAQAYRDKIRAALDEWTAKGCPTVDEAKKQVVDETTDEQLRLDLAAAVECNKFLTRHVEDLEKEKKDLQKDWGDATEYSAAMKAERDQLERRLELSEKRHGAKTCDTPLSITKRDVIAYLEHELDKARERVSMLEPLVKIFIEEL